MPSSARPPPARWKSPLVALEPLVHRVEQRLERLARGFLRLTESRLGPLREIAELRARAQERETAYAQTLEALGQAREQINDLAHPFLVALEPLVHRVEQRLERLARGFLRLTESGA
jgi:hypothetical protein